MRRTLVLLSCLLAVAGLPARAQETVTFPSNDADITGGAPTRITGYLFRPGGPGPFPAIVAFHGCGGLFEPGTSRFTARHREWGERLAGEGFLVLFPDSFTPRGRAGVCRAERDIALPGRERSRDACGALLYLQAQPAVRPEATAVMGWSHGGSTVIWTASARTRARPANLAHDFRLGIALYPGCRGAAEAGLRLAYPVHIFAGADDDWTPPGPCRDLAARNATATFTLYPDAPHGFDAPDQPRRVLTGLTTTASGTATTGTEPRARADVIARIPALLAVLKR